MWSFTKHLTDHLESPRLGDSSAPSLWPSAAAAFVKNEDGEEVLLGACRRKGYLNYLIKAAKQGEVTDEAQLEVAREAYKRRRAVERYMLWIFEAGNAFEDILVKQSIESGIYIGREIPVKIPEQKVSGRIDILVRNPETKKKTIIECKSIYGYFVDKQLGKFVRGSFIPGEPKIEHLMQVSLYQYRARNTWKEDYGPAQLVYGDRGRGGMATFQVWLEEEGEENPRHRVWYQQIDPFECRPVKSPFTIEDLLDSFAYILACVEEGTLPERDYDIQYSTEQVSKLYEAGELNKQDTERHEKWLAYKEGDRNRKINPVVKGDWQCQYCDFAPFCYPDRFKD